MSWIDRGLLLVLALGVWALVFKPSLPNAHHEGNHSCVFTWEGGSGMLVGNYVEVLDGDESLECYHF